MKSLSTMTIFSAMNKAFSQSEYFHNYANTCPRDDILHVLRMEQLRSRQGQKFQAALLARIEAGDRAREALKTVEWYGDLFSSDSFSVCPWCRNLQIDGHQPDCPRQLALQERQP